jgi:hypothetical protein
LWGNENNGEFGEVEPVWEFDLLGAHQPPSSFPLPLMSLEQQAFGLAANFES